MSGSSSHGKTPVGRLLDALGLAIVFAILWLTARFTPGHSGDAALVAAIGYCLLAGTLLSELVEIVGLPHLTGYLAAGMLAGPHIFHLIDHVTVERLKPANTLALSLIALAGGAELKIDTLKKGVKTLLSAMVLQTVAGIVLMSCVFYGAHSFIGFTKDLPFKPVLGVALLWGVLAIARSPSAALGVIQQTRASGKLAQYTIAFVMASDVVVVVMLAAVITFVRPLLDPNASGVSLAAFATLGHELLGSVALGTTLGLVLAIYLRLVGRQLLVVLVALGFGATEILSFLQYDALLTFMVAGFVVQNLSKQGDKLVHGVEQAGTVVYVIFFASAGAHLNVPLVRELWPIALLLAGTRAAITFGAAKFASHIAKDDAVIKRWGWAPLVSQAGFAIGISQIAAREFSFGKAFADLAIATIALNELCGPILFKLALDRAGETKAPVASLEDAEEPA